MREYNDTDRGTVVYNTASDNNTAVVSIAADPDEYWAVQCIGWSFDKKPSGSKLTIEDTTNNTTLLDFTFKSDGDFCGVFEFGPVGLECAQNATIVVSLSGTKMTKNLTVQYA